MIVVDTNILAYTMFEGEKSPLTEQALQKDSDWVAPLLWKSEFLNVLALHLRKGNLTIENAKFVIELSNQYIKADFQVPPSNILDLIATSKCSAYDCEFVALAQELGIQLVTEDQQILEQFPEIAISLTDFIA